MLEGTRFLVILEEHLLAGGMESAVIEILSDYHVRIPTLRIGQNDQFVFDCGGRNMIWEKYGLDSASVARRITEWLDAHINDSVLTP